MEENKFWRNRIEVFEGYGLAALRLALNDFFKDKFVIATQVFPDERFEMRRYDAIVYYKIPPEKAAEEKKEVEK